MQVIIKGAIKLLIGAIAIGAGSVLVQKGAGNVKSMIGANNG